MASAGPAFGAGEARWAATLPDGGDGGEELGVNVRENNLLSIHDAINSMNDGFIIMNRALCSLQLSLNIISYTTNGLSSRLGRRCLTTCTT